MTRFRVCFMIFVGCVSSKYPNLSRFWRAFALSLTILGRVVGGCAPGPFVPGDMLEDGRVDPPSGLVRGAHQPSIFLGRATRAANSRRHADLSLAPTAHPTPDVTASGRARLCPMAEGALRETRRIIVARARIL